jgi:hypothetical protein
MPRRSELTVPPDAMVSVVQREAVAEILAEVCEATGAHENEAIRVFLENCYNMRDNPSLSIRHHGEPREPEEELPADYVFVPPVNPFK